MSLQRGRSNLPRGPKAVLRGLCFIPKLPHFGPLQDLVLAVLAIVREQDKTVDGLVESGEKN